MRDEVRKSALAPRNAPPLLGQVVGSALASISFAPKGYVKGEYGTSTCTYTYVQTVHTYIPSLTYTHIHNRLWYRGDFVPCIVSLGERAAERGAERIGGGAGI